MYDRKRKYTKQFTKRLHFSSLYNSWKLLFPKVKGARKMKCQDLEWVEWEEEIYWLGVLCLATT
jgi:hypothetical protein